VPAYAFAVLAAGWLFWVLPFFLVNKRKQPAKHVNIHIEEKLLASHFGEQFLEFKRQVPAYIPFLR
jgi:protein-S-isoprenylcysteine O-methyltransferase Ste14